MCRIASTMVVRPVSAVLEVLICYSSSSCCGTGGTAHDVVLLWTAARVDSQIIFDIMHIMLNIIIVVVIFIITTIKRIAATITITLILKHYNSCGVP